jgi:glycosyltransferase involved in cell wall biosynthesis
VLTIAIPTYNDADTVADTLESLVRQSRPIESVLVVDDASSDETLAVVRSFQERLSIRILRNEVNLGLVGNWNRCLAECRSKFIWILHSDDWLHPGALDVLLGSLESFEGGLIYVGAKFLDSPGSEDASGWSASRLEASWTVLPAGCAAMNIGLSYVCSGVIVARAAYEDVGGFSHRFPYSPDEELWLRIAQRHPAVVCGGAGLVGVRKTGVHHMHDTWRRPDFRERWWDLHDELLAKASDAEPIDDRSALRTAIETKRDATWSMIEKFQSADGRAGRTARNAPGLLRSAGSRLLGFARKRLKS